MLAEPAYAELSPCPALRPYVACYWTLSGNGAAAPDHRVLPDGCMDLLFDLSIEGPGVAASLIGTMRGALVAPTAPQACLFGVRFRPGEAFGFVTVPAGQVTDRVLPLVDVLGPLAESLRDELASTSTARARAAVLDRRLVAIRTRPADLRVRRAIAKILTSPAEARVAWLARDVGLGERQLERAFVERVGVGPKVFARVARLQALVSRLPSVVRNPTARVRWAELALDLGYADQAHMIREVRRLAGVTPAELARSQAVAMSDSFNPSNARFGTNEA